MHNFEFKRPRSIEDALGLLAERGSEVQFLAGGTDLLIKMRAGALKPELVIDTKKIPELNELTLNDNGLVIGAAVSLRTIYENKAVISSYPALVDSSSLIGSVQVQGRATLGGNLCNAAPSADAIPTLIALGATAYIRSANSDREVPVEEICVAPGKTSLAHDEMLVHVNIPAPAKNADARFLRFIPRNEMDIAVVNAAAMVELNETGDTFTSARIAIGSVAPTPLFVKAAGDALIGKPVTEASIQAAATIARDAATPISDMRGTAEQRKHLVGVFTARVLRDAVERAKEG